MTPDGGRLSRRQLLAGAGLAAAGSLAVGPRTLASSPEYERSPGDWPMAGRTPARTGFDPSAAEFGGSLDLDWSTTLGDAFVAPGLAVVEDTAYTTTRRRFVALDAESGDERWRYAHRSYSGLVGPSASSSPSFEQIGLIGVGEDAAYARAGVSVVAVDRSSGRRQWGFRTEGGGASLLVGDAIFASARFGDDDLLSLDATTGYQRWSMPTSDLGWLAFGGDLLFGVDLWRGSLMAVDPWAQTGRWWQSITHRGPLRGALVAAHDAVVFPGNPTAAFEATGGARRWTHSLDAHDAVPVVGATDDAVVVAEGSSETVAALDPASGDPRWTADVAGLVTSVQPVTTPTAWFVGVSEGVAALDPDTGDELARASVDADFDYGASLALVDDRLYVAAGESLTVAALSFA